LVQHPKLDSISKRGAHFWRILQLLYEAKTFAFSCSIAAKVINHFNLLT